MEYPGSSPEISVIVPVYNCEQYLEQCLDSILNQTFDDIEVLCLDDGSTDNSADILRRYASRDRRVRVLHQQNKGAGAARNHGLREAKGRYLSFLDSDDFFEPDMLEKAYAKAIEDKDDYVVYNSDQYYASEDKYVKVPWSIKTDEIPPYMPFSYRQLTGDIFLTFVGWAWDKLYLHSFITEHDLWFQEQRTTNDMLFVFSALVSAKRISVVDEVLVHQRREREDSLSVTREKSWFCFYDALTALREFLKKEDRYKELEKDFINYALHFSLWHLNSLAYPEHDMLERKLTDEWFDDLGISGKDKDYFYNQSEYSQYLELIRGNDTAEDSSL